MAEILNDPIRLGVLCIVLAITAVCAIALVCMWRKAVKERDK